MAAPNTQMGKKTFWNWTLAAAATALLVAGLLMQNRMMIGMSSLLVLPFVVLRFSGRPSSLGNPFEHIKVEQGVLNVQETLIPVQEIRKVVIDIVAGQGVFALPYNSGGKINIAFDQEHVDDLKDYIKRTIPEVEITT